MIAIRNLRTKVPRSKQTSLGSRPSFTLVELLAVVAIIVILTSIMLLTMRGVERDSLAAKSRSTIMKINEVLASRWEEYLNRPMPFDLPPIAFQTNPNTGLPYVSGSEMARVRLIAIRDLMRLELPDRPQDLMMAPVDINIGINELPQTLMSGATVMVASNVYPQASDSKVRVGLPASTQAMRDRIKSVDPTNSIWFVSYANEELLYLIVEQSTVNGSSAIEMFRNSDITDLDGDGLKEFADAYGTPIRWLRWPAGFVQLPPSVPGSADASSPDFPYDPEPTSLFPSSGSNVLGVKIDFSSEGTDPIDYAMADWGSSPNFALETTADMKFRPHRAGLPLFPLVVSAGPDKRFGLRFQLHSEGFIYPIDTSKAPFDVSNDSYAMIRWPNPDTTGSRITEPLPNAYVAVNPYNYPDPYHPRGFMRTKTSVNEPFLPLPNLWYRVGYPINRADALDNVTNVDEQGGY